MKFVTYERQGQEHAGILKGEKVYDLHNASDLLEFIKGNNAIEELELAEGYDLSNVKLKAPLPRPASIRDFYAFEEHVVTARGKRGLDVVPEWYEFPVFYFTNHHAVKGPEDSIFPPQGCKKLDYELEIACVIGKEGRNIKVSEAQEYIFGYMIMNDWSARDIQAKEMKVGLGPAKGKDFGTSFGPYLVTADELPLHDNGIDLKMEAFVNGERYSAGNVKDMYYSFGELIERASKDVTLYPGEVIGSGTVGSGCILEQTGREWLKPGDRVELSITHLGSLTNVVGEEE
ncbi:fumarylacetoacetate hydrolase family protein [Guptibacillus algicola]|uniref:fumarylacetoacetate hydrolase family protein n=1 Tax=Guptibacillus algicola TaxID=225844 RepID=UPI001CD1ABA1|nr:fumarylacetoacetate hydrolase family protein [Alkalihalobacillus algicola]MCA0989642.1 fumarylacetoacetate hydrolase family protein [Alkalihalobacillus algicola]